MTIFKRVLVKVFHMECTTSCIYFTDQKSIPTAELNIYLIWTLVSTSLSIGVLAEVDLGGYFSGGLIFRPFILRLLNITMAVLITALLLIVTPITLSKANKSMNFFKSQNFLLEVGKITTTFLRNCLRQEDTDKVTCGQHCGQSSLNCLYEKGFVLFDRFLEQDVVQIMDGLELVRYKSDNQTDQEWHSRSIENGSSTNVQFEIARRLNKLVSTHFLRIYKPKLLNFGEGEARHRRRHQMMPMMMVFGVLVLGMVIVPMGFQLLAILGGKALLLAKMALLLTAIQGLKKIATSPYNYGLYQAPPYPWYSDRKWLDDDTGTGDNFHKTSGKSSELFSFLS